MAKLVGPLVILSVLGAWHTVCPCCYPKVFDGQVEITIVSLVGQAQVVLENGYFAQDVNKQKTYYRGKMQQDKTLTNVEILADLQKKLQYTVVDGKCSITNASGPMFECIPKNATKVLSSYIGFDNKRIDSDEFEDQTVVGKVKYTIMKNTCAPLRVQLYSFVVAEYDFYGLKSNISDPGVFNIPKSCKKTVFQDQEILKFHHQLFQF